MDASAWDARYAEADQVWSIGPNEFVAEECAGLSPGIAVDLACGEGRNAIWLADLGWQVTGVDFSPVAIEKARSRRSDGVDWVCADALDWTPPGPVDLVVIAYLQLPAAQRRRAVRNAVSMLGPHGRLVLVAHDSSNLTEGVGGPSDPRVLYTAEDVLADLDGLRYDVHRAGRVGRVVAGEGAHRATDGVAQDCLVVLTAR
ncbi:class I SAM-dependent methyltransferase [Nocardioides limicola]|uniref:class I SAM-dependent methyltransferase n=1 Tax=Nocardioides limicola TaxID=2803368 RepID=UPI00193B5244|nr:class I SAM-dependent methyltransferase [Nocardioides sp. DJM-14]